MYTSAPRGLFVGGQGRRLDWQRGNKKLACKLRVIFAFLGGGVNFGDISVQNRTK